jgi:hypothetical protein
MWYWVGLTTFAVLMGVLVVFVIVGLLEVLGEPLLDGTVERDSSTRPDVRAVKSPEENGTIRVRQSRI